MRDLVVSLLVFGSLPFILRRPWIGIIMWGWLSYMNPHKLGWGFAVDMPFALIVALVTLVGMLFSREPKRIPWTRETVLLLLFVLWMVLTTFFALNPDQAWVQFDKVWRVQLMTFVTLMLITSEQRLKALVWIIALSLGFFGVKGGIFTITTGGAHRVYGPGGFIGGNNEIALAMIMTIPLMRFLQLDAKRLWLKWGLGIAMVLTAAASIGSQSRGAFVAILAMGAFLWLKSRNKFGMAILGLMALLLILAVMPAEYYERLTTIKTYDEDRSAQGRINAWWMAFNLAKARFLGGGFETFQPWLFYIYSPNPNMVHDVHSIYFEVMGEHGFVGFGMFVLLWFFTWRTASKVKSRVAGDPDRRWLGDLCLMVQVSLIGYLSGGAFLGLAYFDMPYHLMTMVVIAKMLSEQVEAPVAQAARQAMPGHRGPIPAGAALTPR